MSISGTISDITRGSLHDGPGIRTVIYFKGCGLRCKWCHNPETFIKSKQLVCYENKCIGCGRCIALCPEHHWLHEGKIIHKQDACMACGKCIEACPTTALQMIGQEMTVGEIIEILKKDMHYYRQSHGGVTFSGGECLLQPEFLAELAKECKELGMHTALESALFVPWSHVEKVLPFMDLFFADLKIADSNKHKEYTGQDHSLIIQNLHKLSRKTENLIVRIPMIPGVNDGEEDIAQFAEIINELGDGVRYVELLKYNPLAQTKYGMLGMKYVKFSEEAQDDLQMQKFCELFSKQLRFQTIC